MSQFSGYLPELGAARELRFQPHGRFYWHSAEVRLLREPVEQQEQGRDGY